ncbi:hypothetical protein TRSC58_07617 [Trypanosoma rangeli SC58]|uniref:Uncharacterized protein n=1 Tax=Trypanosoma rangeli SC58 TaxID=429131 RepID=A0A061IRJ3_TRYRA|nr:hypothetical protein TRSC58_07617 [Trypanosoma rangeli SC58]
MARVYVKGSCSTSTSDSSGIYFSYATPLPRQHAQTLAPFLLLFPRLAAHVAPLCHRREKTKMVGKKEKKK